MNALMWTGWVIPIRRVILAHKLVTHKILAMTDYLSTPTRCLLFYGPSPSVME